MQGVGLQSVLDPSVRPTERDEPQRPDTACRYPVESNPGGTSSVVGARPRPTTVTRALENLDPKTARARTAGRAGRCAGTGSGTSRNDDGVDDHRPHAVVDDPDDREEQPLDDSGEEHPWSKVGGGGLVESLGR